MKRHRIKYKMVSEELAKFLAKNYHFCPISEDKVIEDCTCWGWDTEHCKNCIIKFVDKEGKVK